MTEQQWKPGMRVAIRPKGATVPTYGTGEAATLFKKSKTGWIVKIESARLGTLYRNFGTGNIRPLPQQGEA